MKFRRSTVSTNEIKAQRAVGPRVLLAVHQPHLYIYIYIYIYICIYIYIYICIRIGFVSLQKLFLSSVLKLLRENGNHVGRNHVGRFTRTGCTGILVQAHGLHHSEQHVYILSRTLLVPELNSSVRFGRFGLLYLPGTGKTSVKSLEFKPF